MCLLPDSIMGLPDGLSMTLVLPKKAAEVQPRALQMLQGKLCDQNAVSSGFTFNSAERTVGQKRMP